MNNKDQYKILLTGIGIFALLCSSCSKNKDRIPPQIQITHPAIQSSFSYNETLTVRADVSDDIRLEEVIIELVSSTDLRVLYYSVLHPDISTYTFEQNIPLLDRYWESGKMFVRVTANDGFNTALQIKEFYYNELPRMNHNEWRVVQNPQSYFILNLQDEVIHTEYLEYVCGGYEPRTEKFWIAHGDGSLISRALWNETSLSSFMLGSKPTTSHYSEEYEKFFIGCENGAIWSWQNGSIQGFREAEDSKVKAITSCNDLIYVWREEPVTGQDFIAVYRLENGTIINSIVAENELTAITKFNNDKIIVAANVNGVATFGFVEAYSSAITQNYTQTEITSVQNLWPSLTGGIFALQEIGLISYNQDLTAMQTIQGIRPSKIITDLAGQEYRMITQEGVYRLNSQHEGQLISSKQNIIDYLIIYNK